MSDRFSDMYKTDFVEEMEKTSFPRFLSKRKGVRAYAEKAFCAAQ